MRRETFDPDTSTAVDVPVELLGPDQRLQARLGRLTASLRQASGGRAVAIYRLVGSAYLRVFGEGSDSLPLLHSLDRGEAHLSVDCYPEVAAAVSFAVGDDETSLLTVGHLPGFAAISAAQSYVIHAYAGQLGMLLELDAVWRTPLAPTAAHSAQLERLRLFESVAVNARDSIVITEAQPIDLPGPRILYCNAAFTRMTGYLADEVIGLTPRILQGPKTDPAARARLRQAFERWEPIEVELLNYHKDGSEFWVELSIVPVANDDGWYTHWISVQRDITERRRTDELSTRMRMIEVRNEVLAGEIAERKRVESELLYTAFHDSLTRLRNRAFFTERLKAVLDGIDDHDQQRCAVLFLDLDRFKVVNDSLGHQAGDLLLQEVSRRLRKCARAQDTIARFGGDEFALLIEDARDPGIATAIAERISAAMRPAVRVGRQEVFASCSIGIVHSSPANAHPEALIRDADVAMYVAKRSGFGGHALFDDTMNAEATAMLTLQIDLHNAIERGEFELAFQPIVDPQHSRITGFEALIRWRHPVRGLLQPNEFIAVAEEMGVIRQIDQWVMREACAQLAVWRAQFPEADLQMAVNTSASEFDDVDFVPQLMATLRDLDLPPHALELEITESIFLDPDPRIAAVMTQIRDNGVRLGLDDFGTGYSSLSYLNRYATDTIKIDKSFIDGLCTDDRTLAIVLLIIQLAKTLGLDVVAEGVESEEQAELLASMSCSHAQGYYFARPMTADQVSAQLACSTYIRR